MKTDFHIVFVADTHLGFDYPLRPRSDRPRRGEDFFRNFQAVLDYAHQHKADLILHGGDLFFRSKVHKSIVDRTYQMLSDVAETGIPVVIVPGNHERSVLPGSLFLHHRNIYVFDKPRCFRFTKNELTVNLAGFPCVRDDIRVKFNQQLNATNYQDAQADFRLLCLHQAVDGATVGPANFTFRNRPDTIAKTDLPGGIDLVCSGHIHRHQMLPAGMDGQPAVLYPGSIERTSFAEQAEDKGFIHIHLRKEESPHLRFIPLPTRPMVDVLLDPVAGETTLDRQLKQQLQALPDNAIVRLGMRKARPGTQLPKLTSARIRQWASPGMIVQLSRRLFQPPTSLSVKSDILTRIQNEVPDTPGIYRFFRNDRCIYIGKSVHLRQRMRSYFSETRRIPDDRIRTMVQSIDDFKTTETGSEFLALLCEDAQIKKIQPEFNVLQQEHGEYHWLLLSKDPYPALHIVAHSNRATASGLSFGPFKDRFRAEDTKLLLARHLKFRQCTDANPYRKSINYELGVCSAPCRGNISVTEYRTIAESVRHFLEGNRSILLRKIEQSMQKAVQELKFEQAAALKTELEFCHQFARRQRFNSRFYMSNLQVLYKGSWYRFERGRLVAAKINGKRILKKTLQHAELDLHDPRLLFDRAAIVFRQLQQPGWSGFWY